MSPPTQNRRFRFGVYEADAATGELRKSGVRLRVQEQPFQVLLLLLERPGEVVTREEMRQKLWAEDTFVDFDHSLNSIVNRLREVLGDTANNPRFIETLARRGYRFLAPVECGEATVPAQAKTGNIRTTTASEETSRSVLTRMEELPQTSRRSVRVLFFLIQTMYFSFYVVVLARLGRIEDLLEQVFGKPDWVVSLIVVTAIIGIPVRLFLAAAVSFDVKDLSRRFQRLFIPLLILDGLWALAPFLLAPQIGLGLALGSTAALIYVPFAQRSLLLMSDRGRSGS